MCAARCSCSACCSSTACRRGFAIGTAFASETEGLGLFVILAIALQNVPEGTSVAIPMEAAGFRPRQQFWAAVLTSAPQPIGALVAYALVEQIESLLPFSFAFAAGAMLCLVAVELAPEAFKRRTLPLSLAGTAAGATADARARRAPGCLGDVGLREVQARQAAAPTCRAGSVADTRVPAPGPRVDLERSPRQLHAAPACRAARSLGVGRSGRSHVPRPAPRSRPVRLAR